MSRVLLDSATSMSMERTTVHQQFNGLAFGIMVIGKTIPIILHLRQPGGHYLRSVLVFGPKYRKRIPYKDLGEVEKCCKRVYTFNIRHFMKCYLPSATGSDGQPTEPYKWNNCQKCGVVITDDSNHTIGQLAKRKYRANRYIYRATNTLQDDTGAADLFTHQEGLPCK